MQRETILARVGWGIAVLAGQLAVSPISGAATIAEANPSFDLYEIRVLGNTVLGSRDVERAVYPFLGRGKHLSDVEQARDALADAYRKHGFATVYIDIPEQAVGDDGVVRLAVTEGRVGRVVVRGAHYFSGREIKAGVPAVAPGTVPNVTEFQHELGDLARAAADREVTPILKPSREVGQLDVTLDVKDHAPFHGSIEADNRYTADTSQTRLNATVSYDYLFDRPQSLALQYQIAPQAPSEVKVWALNWTARSRDSANAWAAYAVKSDSDVAAIGTLSVIGRGKIAGVRRILVPISDPTYGLSFTLGGDYKTFNEAINVPSGPPAVTPIHYAVWAAGLNGYLRSSAWAFDGSLTANAGLRGLVNQDEDFSFKRYGASGSFIYWRGNGTLRYTVLKAFSVSLRGEAQYAATPLIANEQFALGGVDTVRGYLEAETLVDRGVAGSLEFSSLPVALWPAHAETTAFKGFLFLDGGRGSIEQSLPGQANSYHLASYGVGAQLGGGREFAAQLAWARAFADGVRTRAGDSKLHFSVQVGF